MNLKRPHRILALLLIVAVLAPGTWLRGSVPPRNETVDLHFRPLQLPPEKELARHLGVFRLDAAWEVTSHYWRFGGYSSLLPIAGGRFLAFSDRRYWLYFSPPGAPLKAPRAGQTFVGVRGKADSLYDSESATIDPATGRIWLGWEEANAISRYDGTFKQFHIIRPPAMRHWDRNTGAEAMVRLRDGRFIVLAEGFVSWFDQHHHHALLFADDPIEGKAPAQFSFAGPANFSPVDMAQLPDGRVLILMRRLAWPFPARFAGRIVIADPRDIREDKPWRGRLVAMLSSSLPVDNFEALAITPAKGGEVNVWLMSDANAAVTQRTLLWKLTVDPARLP